MLRGLASRAPATTGEEQCYYQRLSLAGATRGLPEERAATGGGATASGTHAYYDGVGALMQAPRLAVTASGPAASGNHSS